MELVFEGRPLRILDFDIECRPLSWYGGDWVTKEVTAIAWKWVGGRKAAKAVILGRDGDVIDLLQSFQEVYNLADMVTGHYIRGFDLPVLNSAHVEEGLLPLADKLTHCTKGDLVKFQGLSKSQENLGATLGLRAKKIGMNQDDWRRVNRGESEAIARVEKRVLGDVKQHVEFRKALLDQGLLGRPKVWSSTPTGGGSVYIP